MVLSLFRQKEPVGPAPVPRAPLPRPVDGATRKQRITQAFSEMPLDARETDAICALLDKPDSTAVELSRACGWMDTSWRTQMLLLCQRRRQHFWPEGLGGDMTNGMILNYLTEYDAERSAFRPRRDITRILNSAVKAAI